MKIPNNENETRVFVQFNESSPVLVINPKCVKALIYALEGFKV
jgi:hypothetical protein